MDKLMLVDGSNIFHRGLHVHTGLSYRGVPTGGLYGFVNQLVTLINNHNPLRFGVCGDSPPYLRLMVYPEYKSARKKKDKTEDELKAIGLNKRLCAQFLDLIGHSMLQVRGLEADDLIAALARNAGASYDEVMIVSSDNDLFQLFAQPNVCLVRKVKTLGVRGSKEELMRPRDFREKYPGLEPFDWHKVAAISGGHNGLPGVKSIGESTAVRILTGGKLTPRIQRLLRENEGLIEVSEKLAKLPYPLYRGSRHITLPVRTGMRMREVAAFLNKYGIGMTDAMDRAFESLHR